MPRERRLGARNVADDEAFVLGLDAKDYKAHSLQLLEQLGTRRHALGNHLRIAQHDPVEIRTALAAARLTQLALDLGHGGIERRPEVPGLAISRDRARSPLLIKKVEKTEKRQEG